MGSVGCSVDWRGSLFIGGVMVHFWLTSKDALLASLNTLYPGKRVSTGGKWTIGEFFFPYKLENSF